MCTRVALGAKGAHLAGYAVVEARAHGQDQVGVVDGHVGGVGAVQAQHAEPQALVVAGEAAQPHEGGRHRDVQVSGQPGEGLVPVAGDDAAAGGSGRSDSRMSCATLRICPAWGL